MCAEGETSSGSAAQSSHGTMELIKVLKSEKRRRDDSSGRSDDWFLKVSRLKELLTSLIIIHVLHFSVLSRREGEDQLYQFIKLLSPKIVQEVPSVLKIEGEGLDSYYSNMLAHVKCCMEKSLSHTYDTWIFDGWSDGNSEKVVNVMLFITGLDQARQTFFLRSIYTGSKKCDADFYAKFVTETMADVGNIKKVGGITSDNARVCVSAKEKKAQMFNFMTPNQHWTHLANLLMQEISSLKWISEILCTVSELMSDLRDRPKLYFRFKELQELHNASVRDSGWVTGTKEFDHCSRVLPPCMAVITLKQASTRFATSEAMMQSFLRRKNFTRSSLNLTTLTSIFLERATRVVLQYLRYFEDESSYISEVSPMTRNLHCQLSPLPLTTYFTLERKQEVMDVYDARVHGRVRRIPLLTSLHFVSYALYIRSYKEDISLYQAQIMEQKLQFVRSDVFPQTQKLERIGGEKAAVEQLFVALQCTRMSWEQQVDHEGTGHLFFVYRTVPGLYWIQNKGWPFLRLLALRVLCVSPSSSSVKRSFSLQARIRTSIRNRLHLEKVNKMVFCEFNTGLQIRRKIASVGATRLQRDMIWPASTAIEIEMQSASTMLESYSGELPEGEEIEGELEREDVNDATLSFIDSSTMDVFLAE